MVAGSVASLTSETDSLRRSRLAAAAIVLTVVYGSLFVSNVVSWASEMREVWLLMGARFAFAALVMVLFLCPLALSTLRVRFLEAALFGGLTALIVASQYTVNLALLRRGDVVGVVAFVKNGVTQTFALMMLYGTFVPNNPKTVAKAVVGMVLAPILAVALLGGAAGGGPRLRGVPLGRAQQLERGVPRARGGDGGLRRGDPQRPSHRTSHGEAVRPVPAPQEARRRGDGRSLPGRAPAPETAVRLKMIKPGSSADPMASARFEREVQSAARLAHPNTIEIYDYGRTDDGTFYYVMEYLEGLSLADLVREAGPLPPGRAIYLFRQVCAGLAEAHKFGLVHRDLKPANVFVAVRGGEADVAKVLDFGLVKLTRDPGAAALTADLTLAGTPQFMAPEQATCDRSLDARADIYSLGAMLYYTLTGRPPFPGGSAFAVMMAHARDPVEPPSRIRPELPADLVAVVLRCLAKKPDERFPSVKSLSEALASCVAAPEWGPNRAEAWWAVRGMPDAPATANRRWPKEGIRDLRGRHGIKVANTVFGTMP